MKRKLIGVILGIVYLCCGCIRSNQSAEDMRPVQEKADEFEKQTVVIETETQGKNSAFYTWEKDKFIDEGPVEYTDYYNPDIKMKINVSKGHCTQGKAEDEFYFLQSVKFGDYYKNLKEYLEGNGGSEEDIYCVYFDVELTSLMKEQTMYTIANWKLFQIFETDYGTACSFLSLAPSYDAKPAEQMDNDYYYLSFEPGETKKFRVAFAINKNENQSVFGKTFDLSDTENIYLAMTGDEPIIVLGANKEFIPNKSEDLRLLKIKIEE